MILEEIANVGHISGLKEKLGTMRGRRIYPMMIWQDLVQMKDIYGDTWETVLSKCDTRVYLGINDSFTAKYASENLGVTTIAVQGISKRHEGLFLERPTENQNYQKRELMTPDECNRLPNDQLILMQRSKFPSLLYKTQYKYWEPKHRICEEKELSDMPLLKPVAVGVEKEIQEPANTFTDKEHTLGHFPTKNKEKDIFFDQEDNEDISKKTSKAHDDGLFDIDEADREIERNPFERV
jgi:type IV secretory pathway TraG/TraD family ATPase VirD4